MMNEWWFFFYWLWVWEWDRGRIGEPVRAIVPRAFWICVKFLTRKVIVDIQFRDWVLWWNKRFSCFASSRIRPYCFVFSVHSLRHKRINASCLRLLHRVSSIAGWNTWLFGIKQLSVTLYHNFGITCLNPEPLGNIYATFSADISWFETTQLNILKKILIPSFQKCTHSSFVFEKFTWKSLRDSRCVIITLRQTTGSHVSIRNFNPTLPFLHLSPRIPPQDNRHTSNLEARRPSRFLWYRRNVLRCRLNAPSR